MKTVWNVISENEITDHPTVQTFANEKGAFAMVQELFREYCNEHELNLEDEGDITQENLGDGYLFVFTGGEWEEWVYVMECDITPSTVSAAILIKDEEV